MYIELLKTNITRKIVIPFLLKVKSDLQINNGVM